MLKKKRKKVASRIWCHHCAAFVLERNWCSFSSWYILSSVFVLFCLSATKLHELINLCRHLPEGELFFNGLLFLSNFFQRHLLKLDRQKSWILEESLAMFNDALKQQNTYETTFSGQIRQSWHGCRLYCVFVPKYIWEEEENPKATFVNIEAHQLTL